MVTGKIKAVRYDADTYQIKKNGEIIGFASRYTNGMWCADDYNEEKLTNIQFKTPSEVANWFKQRSEKC